MTDCDILISYVKDQEEKRMKMQTDEQKVLEALCREVARLSNKLSWLEPEVNNLWDKK